MSQDVCYHVFMNEFTDIYKTSYTDLILDVIYLSQHMKSLFDAHSILAQRPVSFKSTCLILEWSQWCYAYKSTANVKMSRLLSMNSSIPPSQWHQIDNLFHPYRIDQYILKPECHTDQYILSESVMSNRIACLYIMEIGGLHTICYPDTQ